MEEVWKSIPEYEQYQVSNYGRIRRWQRRNKKWRYLKNLISGTNDYYMVSLSKNGKVKRCTVHRLVMTTFIPNPNNLPCVNHKDLCKTNNFVFVDESGNCVPEKSNLEWCDYLHNNTYGENSAVETIKKPVLQMKNGVVIKEYTSLIEAANAIGKVCSGISNVLAGRAETCGGYEWKYRD